MFRNADPGGVDIFVCNTDLKVNIWMSTVYRQLHLFSTHERICLWKCRRFWDRKCLDPGLDSRRNWTPNLRTHTECEWMWMKIHNNGSSNLLSYVKQFCALTISFCQDHMFKSSIQNCTEECFLNLSRQNVILTFKTLTLNNIMMSPDLFMQINHLTLNNSHNLENYVKFPKRFSTHIVHVISSCEGLYSETCL